MKIHGERLVRCATTVTVIDVEIAFVVVVVVALEQLC